MYSATILNHVDGEHTTYTIQVQSPDGPTHNVSRRYNDFAALDGHLRKKVQGRVPKMPEKSIFRKMLSSRFARQREKDLNSLLQAYLKLDSDLNYPEFQKFLGVVGKPASKQQAAGNMQQARSSKMQAQVPAQAAHVAQIQPIDAYGVQPQVNQAFATASAPPPEVPAAHAFAQPAAEAGAQPVPQAFQAQMTVQGVQAEAAQAQPIAQAALAPVHAVPAQPMPVQAMPAQAMPAQAMPPQAIPAQAIPAQAMPVQAMPAPAMPAQAIPAQGGMIAQGHPVAQGYAVPQDQSESANTGFSTGQAVVGAGAALAVGALAGAALSNATHHHGHHHHNHCGSLSPRHRRHSLGGGLLDTVTSGLSLGGALGGITGMGLGMSIGGGKHRFGRNHSPFGHHHHCRRNHSPFGHRHHHDCHDDFFHHHHHHNIHDHSRFHCHF